jgi:molybdopterin/thiamine biosynthesis adenylyltransferase
MIWYLSELLRFKQEREAMESLASGSKGQISIAGLRFDGVRLVFDVDIVCSAGTRAVSLRYPNHFPDSPPSVFPRDGEYWSGHQYGRGGELCLEYGPDNWHPDVTGAMLIESAQRLFEAEAPAKGQRGVVASRHATSLGQDLRSRYLRLLVTKSLQECAATSPIGQPLQGKVVWNCGQKSAAFAVTALSLPDGSEWIEDSIPGELKRQATESGLSLLRLPAGGVLPKSATATEFFLELGIAAPPLVSITLVVLVVGPNIRAYCVWKDATVDEVAVIPPSTPALRVDDGHSTLAARTVAIVGCGSIGSKIAVALARSGVTSFLLVDDDIFLPENLVRHDLDWRDVGAHKAVAVAARLQLVNSGVRCETSIHRLGGQEASGGIETLIERLAKCDLVVDATADSHVFGYLCAAARIGGKPLVWAEVFGGGFGGLIGRSRPKLDPDPASAKAIIEAWCRERHRPIERARDYRGGTRERPLIADDADVTVIAGHAARLAIDTLIPREPPRFTQSAYMIGLAKGWLFEQPFDTYPIDLGPSREERSAQAVDPRVAQEERGRILQMFADQTDAAVGSSGDT